MAAEKTVQWHIVGEFAYKNSAIIQPELLRNVYWLSHLSHKNIVPIIKLLTDPERKLIGPVCLPTASLRDRVETGDDLLTASVKCAMVASVAIAIDHCSRNYVIHCAVTPDSVLFTDPVKAVLGGFYSAVESYDEVGIPANKIPCAPPYNYRSANFLLGMPVTTRDDRWGLACSAIYSCMLSDPFNGYDDRLTAFKSVLAKTSKDGESGAIAKFDEIRKTSTVDSLELEPMLQFLRDKNTVENSDETFRSKITDFLARPEWSDHISAYIMRELFVDELLA